MNRPAALAAVFAAAALATPVIAKWEGLRRTAYADTVAVTTICYGHTSTAKPGQTRTAEECLDLLANDVMQHGSDIDRCITRPLPVEAQAAFTSFAFNVGSAVFCRSTMARKANAGDLAGACAELTRWTYAGGRQLPGLVARRAEERAMCERGVR